MELIKDERKIVVGEKFIEITRTTTEQYDAEEYLRTLASQEQMVTRLDNQKEDVEVVIKDLSEFKEQVEKLRAAQIEAIKKEVANANSNNKTK